MNAVPVKEIATQSGRSISRVWQVMRTPLMLCGRTFGLNIKRHRLFEMTTPLLAPPCPRGHPGDWLLVFGHTVLERSKQPSGGPRFRRKHVGTDRGREAMGINWMNRAELTQAIPPAYTQFIGEALMKVVKGR